MNRTDDVSFVASPTLASLSPTSGTAAGGTTVFAIGTSFVAGIGAMCSFGTVRASATVATTSSLSCIAPAHTAGPVTVTVSMNNNDFSTSGVAFTYMSAAVQTSLQPALGPTAGGTVVSVTGSGFVTAMWCQFAASAVSATYVSVTRVLCAARTALGVVNVAVSTNNGLTAVARHTDYGTCIFVAHAHTYHVLLQRRHLWCLSVQPAASQPAADL